jgi:hypothetical protein
MRQQTKRASQESPPLRKPSEGAWIKRKLKRRRSLSEEIPEVEGVDHTRHNFGARNHVSTRFDATGPRPNPSPIPRAPC